MDVEKELERIAEFMQEQGYPAEAQDHVNAACDVLFDVRRAASKPPTPPTS